MTFAELYPTLSSAELQEAEDNFRRYLEIAWEIAHEQEATNAKHAMEDRGREE